MRLNSDLNANTTGRNLYKFSLASDKSLEKLSSGLRLNRASDGAGDMALSEKLRSQAAGLQQAERNIQDGIGFVSVADGVMSQLTEMLQRMRELAVRAATGTFTNDPDRLNLNEEFLALRDDIDRVTAGATFNGRAIFTATNVTLQVGANNVAGDRIGFAVGTTTAASLVVSTNTLDTLANARTAITRVNNALNTISARRARVGAIANRLETAMSQVQIARQNFSAAGSRIRDTDFATEVAAFTKNQIITQSATAMLAQANSRTQNVLNLVQFTPIPINKTQSESA